MNEFEDELCFMVSLYGCALNPVDIVPVLDDAIDFFRASGQPPTHLSVSARGFGDKPLRFDRAWKRVNKAATEDLESASVFSFIEGWSRLSEWNVTCDVFPEHRYFQLGASICSIPDAEPRILAFIHRSMAKMRPAYGIGFFRKRGQGPDLYGIGLSYGHHAYSGPEYEDGLATCRWLDGMDDAVYDDGYLRDVYAYNLLTARHLMRDVDGGPLEAWIRTDPSRGQLAAWDSRYTLWTVNPEHLASMRQQLTPSGILFVRRPETPL